MSVKNLGIIGYGHLGQFLVHELSKVPEFEVVKKWNRTPRPEDHVLPLEEINEKNLEDIDLVIEVADPSVIKKYSDLILRHCDLFVGSPTALADKDTFNSLKNLSKQFNRSVYVPAGAFWGGNDIQKMAELGLLKGLTVTMTKHPSSFKLESPLKELNEEAKTRTEATVLFEGTVRELCPLAPNNVNTMAGAAIAAHSLGFDEVKARLVSDPEMLEWHVVEVEVEGPDGFRVSTKRMNPARPGAVTGQLTYFSFLASIKESRFKPKGFHIC
ncbi:hypothetical protein WR25_12407 [Diploscapter pachys]|uniref:Aspartate dehydrogenase domain-containing protein n=1 Tax=Diploscapter pachys TaxID=2018661 RepID=A0A2A2JNC5_9BILA|nr:hypothetical protein WR25_12407 [Diploscapter pachys]